MHNKKSCCASVLSERPRCGYVFLFYNKTRRMESIIATIYSLIFQNRKQRSLSYANVRSHWRKNESNPAFCSCGRSRRPAGWLRAAGPIRFRKTLSRRRNVRLPASGGAGGTHLARLSRTGSAKNRLSHGWAGTVPTKINVPRVPCRFVKDIGQ